MHCVRGPERRPRPRRTRETARRASHRTRGGPGRSRGSGLSVPCGPAASAENWTGEDPEIHLPDPDGSIPRKSWLSRYFTSPWVCSSKVFFQASMEVISATAAAVLLFEVRPVCAAVRRTPDAFGEQAPNPAGIALVPGDRGALSVGYQRAVELGDPPPLVVLVRHDGLRVGLAVLRHRDAEQCRTTVFATHGSSCR